MTTDRRPTTADVWHRLGKLEEAVNGVASRLEPVEAFAKSYNADRNKILGAMAAMALSATLLVGGVKEWIKGLFA